MSACDCSSLEFGFLFPPPDAFFDFKCSNGFSVSFLEDAEVFDDLGFACFGPLPFGKKFSKPKKKSG